MTQSLIAVFVGGILLLSLTYIGLSVAYGQDMNATSGLLVGEETGTTAFSVGEETGITAEDNIKKGNQSQPMRWLTYEDPILQFSIEYPSTWNIREFEGQVSFEIPDTYDNLHVMVEPLLTLDPSEYARDKLNERREYSLEIIGLNETTINGQPTYRAQYITAGSMSLSYFMVTDDYTGYRLLFGTDYRNDFAKYMPEIERMVNSFQITK